MRPLQVAPFVDPRDALVFTANIIEFTRIVTRLVILMLSKLFDRRRVD